MSGAQRVLQEFYSNGKAVTEPFLVRAEVSWESIREMDKVGDPLDILGSDVIVRYPSGAKYIGITLDGRGGAYLVQWSEEGEVMRERTLSGSQK